MWMITGFIFLGMSTAYGSVIIVPALNVSEMEAASITTSVPSSITSAPWVNDAITVNTCSYINETNGGTYWDDPWCSLYVGTVDLVFWPTDTNYSYPATLVDSECDYTYTSPSVYMIVNTIYARNPCGPLGPSTSREVFAFDLTDVSTLAPYTDATATTRRSTVQLELSDLATDCDKTYNRTELATQTHPILDDDTRCNPFLAFPPAVKRYGYPYWKHCGIKDNKFGIFDPPYAVPTAEALVPAVPTTTSEPEQSANPSAAESASTGASASSDQAPTTAGPTAPVQITDEPSPETVVGETSSIDPQPHAPNPDPAEPTAAEPEDTEPPTEETDSYPDAIVSIVTGEQVVSLGPSGLEIVDVDSGSTTTHFVPAPGATDDGFGEDFNYGSDFAPAPVVIYNGETLSVGGDPATITGAVVVTPSFHNLESISATTSNTTVPASSANRAISGLIIPLAILVLSAHL